MRERLPIAKALAVLEVLNRAPSMPLGEVAAQAGLPKPTAARILSALIAAGYAHRLSRSAGYRVTAKVRALSSGIDAEAMVLDAAVPMIQDFTKTHKWPVFFAVRDGINMQVRFSTVETSPHAVDPPAYNVKSPMLISAVGRAYLAFCAEAERHALLAQIAASRRSVDAPAKDAALIARMLHEIRRKGFATTDESLRRRVSKLPRRWRDSRRQAIGLAVPICKDDKVLATLSLRYFSRMMSPDEAAERYLKPLQNLAADIARHAPA